MGFYQLIREQTIPADPPTVWEFIATPQNLERITPDHMGFGILTAEVPEQMYEGMVLAYRVYPFKGIPTKWVTEITHLKAGQFFVDEQRMGPYRLWHHQHILEPCSKGTRMKDIVSYAPPFGPLGVLANGVLIRPQLETIFEYRFSAMERIFGEP